MSKNIDEQVNDLRKQAYDLLTASESQVINQLVDSLPEDAATRRVHLTAALAGPYSAGKSTLLQALTQDDSIAVGTGITTQETQTVRWKDFLLTDTPGLQTGVRPRHDAIALKALTESDLLIFVVTNELFDNQIVDYYNQLANQRDKAAETLLVVNKMSRVAQGNTKDTQDIIKTDLAQVLPAKQLENIAFIDAKDAATANQESDPGRKAMLLRRSNFTDFTHRLESFLQEKGPIGAQTTALYQIERALTQAQEIDNDGQVRNLADTESILRQHKEIIAAAIDAWTITANNLNHQAQAELRQLQNQALDIYAYQQKFKDAEDADFEAKVDAIAATLKQQIIDSFHAHHSPIAQDLSDLWSSPKGQDLATRIQVQLNDQKLTARLPAQAQPIGGLFHVAAGASGDLSCLSGVSGSVMHEAVLSAGNFLGKNFKPWEAIKMARGIGGAAVIIGPLISVALQIWEDIQESQKEREMRAHRKEISDAFQDVANNLDKDVKDCIHQIAIRWRQESIDPVDAAINYAVDSRQRQIQWQENAVKLQHQARALIQKIHQEGS